jgi:hypothetical protein
MAVGLVMDEPATNAHGARESSTVSMNDLGAGGLAPYHRPFMVDDVTPDPGQKPQMISPTETIVAGFAGRNRAGDYAGMNKAAILAAASSSMAGMVWE